MKTVEDIIRKLLKQSADYNIFIKFNSKTSTDKMSLTNLIRKAISDGYIQKTDTNVLKVTKEGRAYLNKIEGIEDAPKVAIATRRVNVNANNAKLDSSIIAKAYDIKLDFSDEIINIANDINNNANFSAVEDDRVDLRHLKTVTIDSEESKDLDDAFSIESIDDNTYKLYIHISDVSHFVELNSKLDLEALSRGTSTYLIDTVYNMFPSILSNNIFSLNEGVDRFTLSVIANINTNGDILDFNIVKSIIHSDRKLSYNYVQDLIDEKNTDESWLLELIKNANLIKDILYNNRKKKGVLEFNNKDLKIKLDDNGIPLEFNIVESLDSHKIIEEFMLLANSLVAIKLKDFDGVIYRYHGEPDEVHFNNFKKLALNKNFDLNKMRIDEFVEKVRGSEYENLLIPVLLRSMTPSSYSTTKKSHFGLSLDYYTYFTSPIRRYVDLLIHRIVKDVIINKNSSINDTLKDVCTTNIEHLSILDKKAKKAENTLIQIKAARYMKDRLGDEYYGIISSISNKGIFVEVEGLEIEGFIEAHYVGSNYRFYQDTQSIYLDRLKAYELGDRIRILVASANTETGKIQFSL